MHEKLKEATCLLESLDASIKKAVVNNKISNTSPFFLAINQGQLEMVKLLIQHGADIHETAHPENTVDAREGFNGDDFALRQMLMEIGGDSKKEQKYTEIARFLIRLMAASPAAVLSQSQKDIPNIFNQAAQQRDTKKLYEMMRDQSIKDHLKDVKNAQELNLSALVDGEGKTVLEHAIENNDAQFVQMHAKTLSNEQRQMALRYAATIERPRVVLALVPKEANESDEWALKRYFYGIQNLYLSEYKTYQDALALVKQYRKNRVALICSKILRTLPTDIQAHVAEMLNPTVCIREANCIQACMHPQLEQAIITGDNKKIERLIAAGWLTDEHNNQGIDALSLAVHHGHLSIVKQLIEQIPFIQEEQKNSLKKSANDQEEFFKKRLKFDQNAQEKMKKYVDIAQMINAAWPNHAQDTALLKAITEKRTGDCMQALEKGANPNALDDRGRPIACIALLEEDPIFLKMLIDSKKLSLQTLVRDDSGKIGPLLQLAINNNKPAHTRLLLDAGFDPNTLGANKDPIAWDALLQENPMFLKMLIDTKKLSLQTGVKDNQGRAHPLLLRWAVEKGKPTHTKLLLDAGFDPNILNFSGDPIAFTALFKDPIFLKMLIDTKKLSLQTVVQDNQGRAHPLLWWAIGKVPSSYAKLLLDAGFDPNALDGHGNPIAWNALFQDPVFLEMLIAKKEFNVNVMIADDDGKKHSLLWWARYKKKPHHVELLRQAGAIETSCCSIM